MMQELIELLHQHTSEIGSFLLEYDSHKMSYETLEEELKNSGGSHNFFSEEDKKWCIENNTVCTLVWHRDTPVGFYKLSASNWGLVLEQAKELTKEK